MPKVMSAVWVKFDCVAKANNTGKWARCKKCKMEMQGIPSRMEKHLFTCGAVGAVDAEGNRGSNSGNLNENASSSQASTSKQGKHLYI